MSETPDAPSTHPLAAHASPVSQDGFTMIPNTVMLRRDLSPAAKLVYGYLKHLAWKERGGEAGAAREVIAADLNMGVKVVTGYIRELRDAPVSEGDPDPDARRLVEAVRRGLGRTNVYRINDPESGHSGEGDSPSLEGAILPIPARARSFSGPKTTTEEKDPPNPPLLDGPPKVVLAGRQNVALDVLLEVCQITAASSNQRAVQAAVALNGRVTRVTGKLQQPGIRHAFWEECVRQAERDGTTERLAALHADPVRFAALLAARIRVKADAYRRAMPGATLSPKALRDWWFDVDAAQPPGMTPEQVQEWARG